MTTSRSGFALFALALVTYAYFYQAGSWNANSRFDLTRAIVEHHTSTINRYQTNTGDLSRRDGVAYSDKAPGVSWLAAPAWAVVDAGAQWPSAERLAIGAWLATVVAIGVPSALAVVALFVLALRLGLTRGRAALLAVGWALGTLAFPYSTMLYGHQLAAACLLGAFALVVGNPHVSARRLAAVGFMLGASVVVEYSAVLGAIPIAAYALRAAPRARVLAALAAGAAAPLVALATYNMLVFGGPLTLSYEFSTQTHRHAGWVMGLGKPNLDALAKITFSSYRGLFFSAPWLLLALPGAIAWWRRGYRAEVGVCAAIIVLFVWLDASLVDWDGGWAMGPRYLVPALPFLVVLAGGVLVGELPRIAIGAIAVAIGVSIVLMLIGTSVEPAVAVTVKRPFQDFLLPHFAHGELGRSTQSVDMMTHPDHGRMQAWNLGNAVGLDGYASLLPLLAAWIACGIWTVRPRSRAQLDVGRSAAPSMP